MPAFTREFVRRDGAIWRVIWAEKGYRDLYSCNEVSINLSPLLFTFSEILRRFHKFACSLVWLNLFAIVAERLSLCGREHFRHFLVNILYRVSIYYRDRNRKERRKDARETSLERLFKSLIDEKVRKQVWKRWKKYSDPEVTISRRGN